MMQLANKSILITGAGSGMGRATAVAWARKGARLTLSGRRTEPLEETARLAQAKDSEIMVSPGDITDDAWRERTVKQIVDRFGGPDMKAVTGLEAGDIAVGRGVGSFAALGAKNHDHPGQADSQIETMKAGLKARAEHHRSM